MENNIPENANDNCPGTNSEDAGHRQACQGCPNQSVCASGQVKKVDTDLEDIEQRLSTIKHKILVLSGKGGVGKSTIASQLAFCLARKPEWDIGLLDIDICGPSIPKMLGLEGQEVHQSGNGWSPVYLKDNLGVMSIGFMLPNPDDAVIWRGPRKNALIKQFLKDVDWDALDFLIIDAPPGTSDEHISIAQFLKATTVDGAIIVTTPQDVAIADVRKEINFCQKVNLPVLGIIENMKDLIQPINALKFFYEEEDVSSKVQQVLSQQFPDLSLLKGCIEVLDASKGGAKLLADITGCTLLGSIPIDPALSKASENGKPVSEQSTSSKALESIVQKIITLVKK